MQRGGEALTPPNKTGEIMCEIMCHYCWQLGEGKESIIAQVLIVEQILWPSKMLIVVAL